MKRLVSLIVAGGIACAAGTASAGDIAAGKAKATNCVGCHGADGKALNPIYPNLAGQNVDYIVKQLKAFKDGSRQDPIMVTMVTSLSEADMANVAAFFNSLGAK